MIGMVNIQWFDNPGAVWLAYSLQEAVKKIKPNEEVVIVDYAAGGARSVSMTGTQRVLSKIKRKAGRLKFYLSPQNRKFRKELANRHNQYEKFRQEYLARTPRFTKTDSAILGQAFSACIVGSDVVWKPEIAQEADSKIYFLKFAGKNTKKIAYAASIGTDDAKILNELDEIYKNLISDFDSISVRESTAVQYIQQLTDKRVYHVLDPVFLTDVDVYRKLIENEKAPCEQKFIYLYMLSYNEEIVSLALDLAKKNNYKIIYDLHTEDNIILEKKFGDYGIASTNADPLQFLALIDNAEMVLCDSFHGTAFSIIFHKEFYTFGKSNSGIDISTRMKDLLESLSLMNRYGVSKDGISNKPINYEMVDQKLRVRREESIRYLADALSG